MTSCVWERHASTSTISITSRFSLLWEKNSCFAAHWTQTGYLVSVLSMWGILLQPPHILYSLCWIYTLSYRVSLDENSKSTRHTTQENCIESFSVNDRVMYQTEQHCSLCTLHMYDMHDVVCWLECMLTLVISISHCIWLTPYSAKHLLCQFVNIDSGQNSQFSMFNFNHV